MKTHVICKQHKYSTATLTISHRKLNLLGRQISGKPIDTAIMQMAFSEKRISNRVKNMLVVARNHATEKGMERDKLVVGMLGTFDTFPPL
jgi:large subunit ribosomal protein L22